MTPNEARLVNLAIDEVKVKHAIEKLGELKSVNGHQSTQYHLDQARSHLGEVLASISGSLEVTKSQLERS